MDCEGRSCNAIEIIPEAPVPVYNEPLSSPSNDQSIWATEDDYRVWNDAPFFQTTLNPSHDNMQHTPHLQLRAGSQHSPNKMPSGSSQRDSASSSSKLMNIGKTLFKTKLCCKFRSGTCAYITNCNFAHSMEELRKSPPNWQETVLAHDGASVLKLREERQIPILTSSAVVGDGQRSYKGRHCKKFYNDEGCPYGDSCSFLHDEQSRARESVAISLSPTIGGDGCGIGGSGSFQKPSNWKTRICNKWEMTGHCMFGSKCHFAHGAAELHGYCGGLAEFGANEASCAVADPKKVVTNTTATIDAGVSYTSLTCADTHPTAAPLQWPTAINPRMIQRPIQKWKGPDKISRIYGDWINDID